MNNTIKDGVWPAMVTPFDADLNVSYDDIGDIVEFYYRNGCVGVFAACLTSEVARLTGEEIVRIAAETVAAADKRIQVVGGAIVFDNPHALPELVRRVYDTGVDAVVVAASQLCADGESESVMMSNLEKLMETTGTIPLGIYECPYPYHRVLSQDLYRWIAGTGRFVFHKDTSCNIEAIHKKITVSGGTPLKFFNAHCATFLDSLVLGGNGYCGVGTNFYPEIFTWLYNHYNVADPKRVQKIFEFAKRSEAYFDLCDAYPATAKAVLKLRGLSIEPYCRINAVRLDDDAMRQLRQLAEQISLISKDIRDCGASVQAAR
jgi:4-hydroxy-tetrahydrodipicolinate synthase